MNNPNDPLTITVSLPDPSGELHEGQILVLDLDTCHGASEEENVRCALRWMQHHLPEKGLWSGCEPPAVIVLGSLLTVSAYLQEFKKAGALFMVKPTDYPDDKDREEKEQYLKRWLDDREPLAWPEAIPHTAFHAKPLDLSIYENPPYQVSHEDFQQLLERMNTPDEAVQKDD